MPRSRQMPVRASFFLGVAALCAFAAISIDFSTLKGFMPIRYVRVEGEIRNLDAEAFERALLPLTQVGYLLVDMRGIEDAAKSFPWLDRVQVTRLWPDTLLLKIVEQKPVARTHDGSLINDRGTRFSPGNIQAYASLPMLDGPPGQEKQLLNTLYRLNRTLKQKGMRVDALRLTGRRAWSARLTSGMEIEFGKQDPVRALERLLGLLPRLGEARTAALQKVDLRYPNGFAVIFRPQSGADQVSLMRSDRLERSRIRSRAYS